jgi:hypothetical protein
MRSILRRASGHVFLEPPAQTAVEIQLPFARVVVVGGIGPAQRVIPRPVQQRALQRHRIGMLRKVGCIKVDHIGQHRLAPFLGVKGQHLADVARFAKGVEQVFGVVAVVEPAARGCLDHPVHGGGHRALAMHVVVYPVDARIQRGINGDLGRGQQQDRAKARVQMVAQGAVHLDRVLGHDDRHRARRQRSAPSRQKRRQTAVPQNRPHAH